MSPKQHWLDAYGSEDEVELARAALGRRAVGDDAERRRAVAFLGRRGFSASSAWKAVRDAAGESAPTSGRVPEPMIRVHVLRHAKSSWDDPGLDDHDRPLAPRGKRAGAAMARWIAAHDVRPAVVLCSSAVRARATLELVLPALGEPSVLVEAGSLRSLR